MGAPFDAPRARGEQQGDLANPGPDPHRPPSIYLPSAGREANEERAAHVKGIHSWRYAAHPESVLPAHLSAPSSETSLRIDGAPSRQTKGGALVVATDQVE